MQRPDYEPVSTVIIGKNCHKDLKECLESLKGFVLPHLGDEVVYLDTGSTDGDRTLKVAQKWGCRTISRPDLSEEGMIDLVAKWLPDRLEEVKADSQFANGFLADFAAARQIVTDAAKNSLIFWIDTDDILQGGPQLRAYIHEYFKAENNALFLPYDYAFDPDGTCTTVLWRERVLRREKYEWVGVCHETLIPKSHNPEHVHRCPYPQIRINHKNHRKSVWSDIRNYVILRNAHEKAREAGEWLDPRWEFYLGNALRGMENFDEAAQWYSRVLKHSGSREDRFVSACNIATIYMIKQRHWFAMDWFWQAVKIFPTEPRAYFGLARCWHELKRPREALHFTDIGTRLPKPELLTAVDPTGYDFYPRVFAAMDYKDIGDYGSAIRLAEEAYQLRPDFEPAQELRQTMRAMAQNEGVKQSIQTTLNHASSIDKAKDIVQSLKPEVRKGFRLFQLEAKHDREPGTITYLATETAEQWDGSSSADGIGGSEKMVMLLTREWARRGHTVEVFGNPKDENLWKTIDGVQWKPVQAFNPASTYDTLVVWRAHGLLDLPLKARKLFVDLHDVQSPGDYLEGRMMKVDGYLFKSEFHADPVRDVVDPDKLIITRNGVDLAHFAGSDLDPAGEAIRRRKARDLQKIVYCSSGDRGLKNVLKIWQRIQGGYPNATLHIFYGFTPLYHRVAADREYAHFGDEGCERHMRDYEEECFQLMDHLPRVVFHGRVSHQELANHLIGAGIWLYPTRFPEISCMAAMEAQIAGCVPVLFPTGALAETVSWGHKVTTNDEIIVALRDVLARGHDLDDEREKQAIEAHKRFDINSLAADWLTLFEGPDS